MAVLTCVNLKTVFRSINKPFLETWCLRSTSLTILSIFVALTWTMPLALAVTVLSQALLISWAAMRPVLGVSYIFSNFAMVFLGIHLLANSSSHQAYAIFIIFFTFTIFHDVLCWLAYFPEVSQMKQFEAIDILSFTVAIASTLLKPCQSVLLCRQFSKQGLDMSWSSLDHMFRLDSVRANNGLEGKEYNPINAGEEYNPIHDHKKFSTMPP